MSPKANNRGFTLFDSLVAIAILALGLPSVFDLVRSSVGRIMLADRREAYWRVADGLMTETVATLAAPVGIREGTIDDMTWIVETRRAEGDAGAGDEAQPHGLVHVTVTVRGLDPSRAESPVILETLAFADPPR